MNTKTFEAIEKLKEVELELHRLKNALEVANKALDAQRTWVGLTDEEIEDFVSALWPVGVGAGKLLRAIEAKLKEKNT
jgi:uncharacterized protein (DUF1778 family)